jgi:beta-phosphoglucomutase-like phosphatase (HAD superfamily)
MRAIIFDMDGVLVTSMPYHYQAMKTAIKQVVNIDLDKRTFYLFEGMPIAEMALEILKIKGHVDVKKYNVYAIGVGFISVAGQRNVSNKAESVLSNQSVVQIFRRC